MFSGLTKRPLVEANVGLGGVSCHKGFQPGELFSCLSMLVVTAHLFSVWYTRGRGLNLEYHHPHMSVAQWHGPNAVEIHSALTVWLTYSVHCTWRPCSTTTFVVEATFCGPYYLIWPYLKYSSWLYVPKNATLKGARTVQVFLTCGYQLLIPWG